MRRIHIRKLHEQFLQCSICSKKVSQRCFRSHLERHNKEQMCRYKCFMCNKGFLTKDKLKVGAQTRINQSFENSIL